MYSKMKFGLLFQLDVLWMMINSTGFLLLCKKYVSPEYFVDRMKIFVGQVYKYYDDFGVLPDKTFFKSICKDRRDREIIKLLYKKKIVREDFIRTQLREFIQRNIFVDYYTRIGKEFNKGDIEKSYELMMSGSEDINKVNFHEDKFDYLIRDFNRRMVDRSHIINTSGNIKIPTGIHYLDKMLKGGVSLGEVIIYIGDAKAGKSFALIHSGATAVKRLIATLHIQLEGKRFQVLDRYDANFTGALYDAVRNNEIPMEILQKMERIARRRKMKDLIVRSYEDWDSADILDIERDLIELKSKGHDIKLVVIDYLELMRARKKFVGENSERFRQQSIARDLKTFAVKNNVAVITASQAVRISQEQADDPNFYLTSKNISEDYGKIRVADGVITINSTQSERKRGYARLFVDTVRDNPAKRLIYIKQDLDRSRFYVKTSMLKKVPAKKEDEDES